MKRLYRNKAEGRLAGVCAGIGDYFDIDPVIVRVIFIVLLFWYGSGLIAYLAAWILAPVQPPEA